jgi:adenylate kinase family enzyme
MPSRPDLGRRVIITGSPGSGKTVLAKRLSRLLDVELIWLDGIVLDARGNRKPLAETSSSLEAIARTDAWVLDGRPGDVPDHAWNGASAVVVLDLPRVSRAWRWLKRGFPRELLRRRMWGGIRYALAAPQDAGERLHRYVRDKTPMTVPLIEISSPRRTRDLIRDVGDSA